jgi:hypothetical protein
VKLAHAFRTTNATAPPPDAMRFMTSTDPYVLTDVVEKETTTGWQKISAYTQGSLAIGTEVCSSPVRAMTDTCIFTHIDDGQIWLRALFESALHRHFAPSNSVFEVGSYKSLLMLRKESNLTVNAGLVALRAFDMHADLKADNIIRMYADLLDQVADPLKGYEQYEVANWDGEDADPITADTLIYARKIMKIMPTSLGVPDIAPAGDGSIALEWVPDDATHKLDRLFLDIGPGEVWRAYWTLRTGEFRRITGAGFSAETETVLKDVFYDLSA